MKKYALIGKNIQDSLSPVIHNSFGCQYDLLDVEEDQLEWALQQDYDGFNVTAPYKEKICRYLEPTLLSSVNTIIKDDDGVLTGFNTDSIGLMKALEIANVKTDFEIGIIGKGGAAKAIASAFVEHNISYRIIDSYGNKQNYESLRGVINASPRQDFDLARLDTGGCAKWVMDLGYKDKAFINNARANGNFAFNGFTMLYEQAKESQRIWNA